MRDYKYYQYRQRDYAALVYLKGIQSNHWRYELRLVALFLRDVMGCTPKPLRQGIIECLQKWDKRYTLNKWCVQIEQTVAYARNKKHKLVQCDGIPMYQSEVEYIKELDISDDLKRAVWTMMVQKKLDKVVYETRHEKPYQIFIYGNSPKRLKAFPRVAGIKKKRGFDTASDILHPLYCAELIDVLQTRGDPFKLNFADKIVFEGEEAVRVTDYEHIGLYWDYVTGGKVGLCEVCGAPFKRKGTGRPRKVCDDCVDRTQVKDVEIVECVDCGKVFVREVKNTRQLRCAPCQEKFNKAK